AAQPAGRPAVTRARVAAVALFGPLLAAPALAQRWTGEQPAPARPANSRPRVLSDIGFDQRLGDVVPLDATFRDESGRAVRLGDYFGRRPVVLSLAYYEC